MNPALKQFPKNMAAATDSQGTGGAIIQLPATRFDTAQIAQQLNHAAAFFQRYALG